jgi:hypothetical protein
MFLTQNLGDAGQGGDGRCLCALPVSGGVGCLWGGEIRIQLYRCVACVSRLPPVSFYRCVAVWAVGTGEKSRCGLWGVKSRFFHANLEKHKGTGLVVSICSRRKE